MAKKLNGTLRTAGIILGIVLTFGSIIWAIAMQSGDLEGAIEDIAEQKTECAEVEERVNTVEKAVIKIETKMEHFQKGQDDMMTIQREILDELRRP